MYMNTRNIEDFGEKIGGARKDIWRSRGLNIDDLKDLTLKEYAENVTKENIWPIKDYTVYKGKMEPVCIYFMKVVRDKLKARITLYEDEYNYERAELYIKFIRIVKDICESYITKDDILKFKSDLMKYYKDETGRWISEASRTQGLDYTFLNATELSSNELNRLTLECELQGFPDNFRGDFKGIGIHKTYSGAYAITASRKSLTNKRFDTAEEALRYIKSGELAKELDEKKKEKKVSTIVNVVRPQLEFIERIGPDLRNNKDVTTDDILDIFKFRGGEFGNWNTQDDRQACLNYVYDSFVDLSYIMRSSLDFVGLGFNGGQKLAIAFGSRGRGKFLAHYEPARVVINLTKMKGAGSLAHEFGHALDDALGLANGERGLRTYITEAVSNRYRRNTKGINYLERLILKLIQVMLRSDEVVLNDRQKKDIELANKDISLRVLKIRKALLEMYDVEQYKYDKYKIIEDILLTETNTDSLEDYYRAYRELTNSDIPEGDKYMLERYIDIIEAGRRSRRPTKFYSDAKLLDAGRKQIYYSSICEMFARCFESYIEDKLHEAGLKSEYLVHSTTNDKYGNLSPYPYGDEREKINDAIGELLIYITNVYGGEDPLYLFKKYVDKSGYSSYINSIKVIKKGETDNKRETKRVKEDKKEDKEITSLQDFREALLRLGGNNTSKDKRIDCISYMRRFVTVAKTKLGYNAVGFKEFNGAAGDGNSKAYQDTDIQAVGRAIVLNKSDKQEKQLEGLIEAIVHRYTTIKYGVSIQSLMISEGVTYMICKSIGLDVRTYCLSDKFEMLATNDKQSKNFINISNKIFTEIIRLFKGVK